MSSREFIQHATVTAAPVTGQVGDEYFNPITNKLYKNLTLSGINLSYQEIPVLSTTGGLTITGGISVSGNLTLGSSYTEKTAGANTSTAYTIDLANGTLQILTLTGNCTFTFPTATIGQSFIMLLKQDGTGNRTVIWPASVKWPSSTAPTITTTANKLDKFVFTADGANWLGSVAGQAYL
jgi:hypothetical protein